MGLVQFTHIIRGVYIGLLHLQGTYSEAAHTSDVVSNSRLVLTFKLIQVEPTE